MALATEYDGLLAQLQTAVNGFPAGPLQSGFNNPGGATFVANFPNLALTWFDIFELTVSRGLRNILEKSER